MGQEPDTGSDLPAATAQSRSISETLGTSLAGALEPVLCVSQRGHGTGASGPSAQGTRHAHQQAVSPTQPGSDTGAPPPLHCGVLSGSHGWQSSPRWGTSCSATLTVKAEGCTPQSPRLTDPRTSREDTWGPCGGPAPSSSKDPLLFTDAPRRPGRGVQQSRAACQG